MLQETIILCLLFFLPIAFVVNGIIKKKKKPNNRFKFYIKEIIVSISLLAVFLVINPSIFYTIDFSTIYKGFHISMEAISAIIPIFFLPFVFSFTSWDRNYPKDITVAKELFGYPIYYLPNTFIEYFLFVLYIIIGVFFEELLCRQFMFHSFNTTLHLNGDILVAISSLLFGIGHLYQGWKGVLANFIVGLLLGKVFLITETLAYPIVLHLFLNLTITVLAFKRLKEIRKTIQKPEDVSMAD